jgi:hypothetical protein
VGAPQKSRYRAASKARAAILRRQASGFMASGRGRLPYKMREFSRREGGAFRAAGGYNLPIVRFRIVRQIGGAETIAAGSGIREIARLRKSYGPGRWRKLKGRARIVQ